MFSVFPPKCTTLLMKCQTVLLFSLGYFVACLFTWYGLLSNLIIIFSFSLFKSQHPNPKTRENTYINVVSSSSLEFLSWFWVLTLYWSFYKKWKPKYIFNWMNVFSSLNFRTETTSVSLSKLYFPDFRKRKQFSRFTNKILRQSITFHQR